VSDGETLSIRDEMLCMMGAYIDFQDFCARPQWCTTVHEAPPKRAGLVVASTLHHGKRNAFHSAYSKPSK
jgi:hypothetical protein